MNLRTLLARAKRQLFKKPFLQDQRYPPYWFDQLLGGQAAFLVQIGSNDGKTGDPLYPLLQKHPSWKALFVEPVPYVFEQLRKNYPDHQRFRFENVAINKGEQLSFHWVDPKARDTYPDLPYWFDQLGSFDKQHILKHFDGKLAPFIISKELEGIPLPTLFERNQVQQIDILHIDTEGYDWTILSQLDLAQHRPKFILYEHNHLSSADLEASKAFLREDYWLFEIGIDMLAVRRDLEKGYLKRIKKQFGKV
ncbi:MAG: FkbM family methyltransferase [Bacteroidota bacterium]